MYTTIENMVYRPELTLARAITDEPRYTPVLQRADNSNRSRQFAVYQLFVFLNIIVKRMLFK